MPRLHIRGWVYEPYRTGARGSNFSHVTPQSTIRWLTELHKAGKFAHAGVERDGAEFTYQQWNDMLQGSFEKIFYIPENAEDDKNYLLQTELVHR